MSQKRPSVTSSLGNTATGAKIPIDPDLPDKAYQRLCQLESRDARKEIGNGAPPCRLSGWTASTSWPGSATLS